MLIERVPSSRPNSPEESAALVEGNHPMMDSTNTPPVMPVAIAHLAPPPASSLQHPHFYQSARQHFQVEGIKQHFTPPQPMPGYRSGYQPPVRLYEHQHHPRQPFPTAIYPTPPLPPSTPVRLPLVEQYPGSIPPAAPVQAPSLQPLTVYTGCQPCTALSAPSDVAKYGKSHRGLLMTVDGAQGGRGSPIPATEASPGGIGLEERPKTPQSRKKRSHDSEDGSSCGSSSTKKARFSFSLTMLEALEQRFAQGRYIAADERRIIADKLGISDVQVKNWFQNRRMKWKRHCASHQIPSGLSSQTKHPSVEMQHAMSSVSVAAGSYQQSGNAQVVYPAPYYTTSFPFTAPPSVSQQTSPKQLASNASLSLVHPRAVYPRGFAYAMPFPPDEYGIPGYKPNLCQEEASP